MHRTVSARTTLFLAKLTRSAETFIKFIEEQSGIQFHEAMTALARVYVGRDEEYNPPTETIVVLPTGGLVDQLSASGQQPELKTETYKLPQSYEEAQEIVDRWHRAAVSYREGGDIADNVVQHTMEDRTNLHDEGWLGTPEEEKAAYISELLYIHAKVMIVDDRRVIVSTHRTDTEEY